MLLDRILFNNRTPAVLKKALDFQSQRHLLVSSNISNLDTPGFKAKDVNFEGQLRQAIGTTGDLKMATTHGKHIGPGNSAVKKMSPDVFEEPDPAKSNGNNVNLDKEMMKLAENQIAYNATTQLLGKRASTIRAAITEIAQ
ncbi:MAG: flagellar basal body rod protein FlgB [Candidatus Nitronauta litoralis]|uniref:Flagellar basal body rod protein FlgB n=1 Tax=Candidatus Nitronauta litoralis TaxID=2705533 RepID=A0A7T0BYZ1_9BACT|nr:MAG: flagellar basal body rod protein FlgB [Candidatus Nitronauta litoralis]